MTSNFSKAVGPRFHHHLAYTFIVKGPLQKFIIAKAQEYLFDFVGFDNDMAKVRIINSAGQRYAAFTPQGLKGALQFLWGDNGNNEMFVRLHKKNNAQYAETIGDHILVGIRKWWMETSENKSEDYTIVKLFTEAYDWRNGVFANKGFKQFGETDTNEVWVKFFRNLVQRLKLTSSGWNDAISEKLPLGLVQADNRLSKGFEEPQSIGWGTPTVDLRRFIPLAPEIFKDCSLETKTLTDLIPRSISYE